MEAEQALELMTQEDAKLQKCRLKKLSNKLVSSSVFQVVLAAVWRIQDDLSPAQFARFQLINRQCYE